MDRSYCGECVDKDLYRLVHNAALLRACERGCVQCLNLAINAGADVNRHGHIAMGLATNRRHFDCVALLAKAGVDVNVQNNEEKMALQCGLKEDDHGVSPSDGRK